MQRLFVMCAVTYQYECKCVFSCRTFDEIVFRNTGKDRV